MYSSQAGEGGTHHFLEEPEAESNEFSVQFSLYYFDSKIQRRYKFLTDRVKLCSAHWRLIGCSDFRQVVLAGLSLGVG